MGWNGSWQQTMRHGLNGMDFNLVRRKCGTCGYDDNGLNNEVFHSADGVNWTRVNVMSPFTPRYHFSAHAHDGDVVLGGAETIRSLYSDVYASSDGVHWELVTSTAEFALVVFIHPHHLMENRIYGGYDGRDIVDAVLQR